MEEQEILDLELLKRKIVSGVVTFTLRTFFIQAFSFIAIFILTIILNPSIFGIFFLVSAILNLFIYFSDIGLAAALIQKKEKLTQKDLSTTFFIQQGIILSLITIGLLSSGIISSFYNLDESGLLLLRVLILSLFLSSLKTLPSIILERNLNFAKLVIPQIVETVVFYSTAVILAMKGFGINSFTLAVFARGVTGLGVMYLIMPWFPSPTFDKNSAKQLIKFGIPFQTNSVLALFKDDLLTVFLGKILNYTQVGYIGWAQKFAFIPLRFVMDNVIKVTFPAYSRLQNDKKSLEAAIERSLFAVTFFVYPLIAGVCAIAPKLILTIPNYGKWHDAVPALFLFGINAFFASVNTTLTNTLFALGKPQIVLKLMFFWTILTWILTYSLFNALGFIGVPLASALVAASTSIIIYYVKKEVKINIIKNISTPIIASITMFTIVYIIQKPLQNNIFSIAFLILIGAIVYVFISFAIEKNKIIENFKLITSSIKNK